MSAITPNVPYVAPWQAEFRRYSVQRVKFTAANASDYSVTIPTNQWWRIASVYAHGNLSNAAGNRLLDFTIKQPGSVVVADTTLPVALTASQSFVGMWGPGWTPAAVSVTTGVWGTSTIPDLLWPYGTVLNAFLLFPDAADNIAQVYAMVEIYVEDSSGNLVLAELAPTPIIG